MDERSLRRTIGSRTRARRKELGLTQKYLADKLDVNASTIQRYETGTIDNTKRLIVEGLASTLHVTPEYLRGETDDMKSEITEKRILEILDAMEEAKETLPLGVPARENEFAENMLLLLLREYASFTESFSKACQRYSEHDEMKEKLSEVTGFDSETEYDQIFFLTEIMHTVNTFHDLSEILRNYAHDPDLAGERIKNMLKYI